MTKNKDPKRILNTLRKPEVKLSQISMISCTQHFLRKKLVLLGQKERRKNGIKEEASQSHPENKIPTNLSGRGKKIPLPIPTTEKTKTKFPSRTMKISQTVNHLPLQHWGNCTDLKKNWK